MVWKTLFILLLVSALAEEELSDRQKQARTAVEEVLASARKDSNGLVTPTEYGRLLLSLLGRLGRLKKGLDWETMVEEYVSTLSGPVDPKGLAEDMASGRFSRKIADADLLIRKRKRDL